VTGQKIWTSYAPIADFQELLVRTGEPELRHRGLTWIICDMRSPGISIRPIPNVHGIIPFAEVFYDEVHIPLSNVVDVIGEGWSVAMSTLSFERGTAAIAHQIELAKTIERIVEYARSTTGPDGRRPAIVDDDIGRKLALVRAEAASLRAMTYRIVSRAAKQGMPGPESSIIRLYYSELVQRVMKIAYDIEKGRTELGEVGDRLPSNWWYSYLDSVRTTVGAGTKDIQRNIIGERVLGLARGR
jgi:alkylation response protein AidB-like acyl-CoA dehydrogenase